MHEAGLWGAPLLPLPGGGARGDRPGCGPSEVASSRRCASRGSSTTRSLAGPASFRQSTSSAAFPAGADRRRPAGRPWPRDLCAADHRERARPADAAPCGAPGDGIAVRERSPTAAIDPPGWPTWSPSHAWTETRRCPLGPLAPAAACRASSRSTTWTRPRDAYFTGVLGGARGRGAAPPYAFFLVIWRRGLTSASPGMAALEILTARLFMYQQVYFHRTVREDRLDLAEVRAIFGDGSPADDLGRYADLDEYALLHGCRWGRGEDVVLTPGPGDGRVAPHVAGIWRQMPAPAAALAPHRGLCRARVRAGPPAPTRSRRSGPPRPGRDHRPRSSQRARRSRGRRPCLRHRRAQRPPAAPAGGAGTAPAYALIGRRYSPGRWWTRRWIGDPPPRANAHRPGRSPRSPRRGADAPRDATELDQVARAIARRAPRFVLIAARGTSDHAAIYARCLHRDDTRHPGRPGRRIVWGAASLRWDDVLLVAVSQSGATGLTWPPWWRRPGRLAPTLAITNEPSSALAAAAEMVVPPRRRGARGRPSGAQRSIALARPLVQPGSWPAWRHPRRRGPPGRLPWRACPTSWRGPSRSAGPGCAAPEPPASPSWPPRTRRSSCRAHDFASGPGGRPSSWRPAVRRRLLDRGPPPWSRDGRRPRAADARLPGPTDRPGSPSMGRWPSPAAAGTLLDGGRPGGGRATPLPGRHHGGSRSPSPRSPTYHFLLAEATAGAQGAQSRRARSSRR